MAVIETPADFDYRGLAMSRPAAADKGHGASQTGRPNKPNKSSKSDKHGKSDKADKKHGEVKTTKEAKETSRKDAGKRKAAPETAPALFEPMTLRGLTVRNRIWLPPMCTYEVTARDGRPTPFHYQHYVSRALGGFGMVIAEATAICPEGRISPCDLGLWDDSMIDSWRWIVDGIRAAGATAAIQLNHAGRKASTGCTYVGHDGASVPFDEGGWQTVAPSPIPFGGYATPRELTIDEIHGIVWAFGQAARRAVAAGFQSVQIHAAHGYLLSEFLDPLTNERTDEYGGDLDGRSRMLFEVVAAVRENIPDDMPLMVRVSATDWAAGGWDLDQTVTLAKGLKEAGVDLVDVSTGGIISGVTIPVKPNYQVPFSQQVREHAGMPVTAVGLITKAKQAEKILAHGEADAIEIGRAALRDPYWPLRAAHKLGVPVEHAPYPQAYVRGAF